MLEGLFSPLHLVILVLVALTVFGIPLLLVFLLARWLDKRLQRRPGNVIFAGTWTDSPHQAEHSRAKLAI
jgi:hypothetical protein